MSGGHWDYQEDKIRNKATEVAAFLGAVAESEKIIDWALSGDSSVEGAKEDLWNLWIGTFNQLYGAYVEEN